MDSFVIDTLNRATIEQDQSRVVTLGPLALGLRSMLYGASEYRQDVFAQKNFNIYKGLLLDKEELTNLRKLSMSQGQRLSLVGFTSTSLSQQFIE